MKLSKQIFGWMMYDFANSAFTTIIVTVVYSVYFINTVVGGDPGYGEMLWGRAIGISSDPGSANRSDHGCSGGLFPLQKEVPLYQLLSHGDLHRAFILRGTGADQ
ncbi:MAG: hypothetical protein LRZ88_12945 [Candidatus Cloacimonetes bacterium]|nr:hypothetical protein [Candidatus Cloacimonadota bacterium]